MTITILLIGKTGAGKSTVGNALLGWLDPTDPRVPFKSSSSINSETSESRMVEGTFFGDKNRPIRLIDTPGFADTKGIKFKDFSNKLSEMMKNAGHVNVLLWCKNGEEDRFDANEWGQLRACSEIFGEHLFANMVMNLSRWRHDESSERRRQLSHKTLDKFKQELQDALKNVDFTRTVNLCPVFTLDALCDDIEDDSVESKKFRDIKEEMWQCFSSLSKKPVFTKEFLEEQRKALEAKKKAEEQEKLRIQKEKEQAAIKAALEKKEREYAQEKQRLEAQRAAEARRAAEAQRAAEQYRLEAQRAAEAQRQAEVQRQAEAQRQAQAQRLEDQRQAQRRAAEAQRTAEAQRQAEAQREAERQAEREAWRQAEREAERRAEREAERQAEERRRREELEKALEGQRAKEREEEEVKARRRWRVLNVFTLGIPAIIDKITE